MSHYILVVDGDVAIRSFLTALLTMEGFSVREAPNGQEALALIECERPWIMLLDVQMPVLDGRGLVERLRERGERIPTIIMTAGGTAQRISTELGADAYLSKPFNLDEILDTIARVGSTAPLDEIGR